MLFYVLSGSSVAGGMIALQVTGLVFEVVQRRTLGQWIAHRDLLSSGRPLSAITGQKEGSADVKRGTRQVGFCPIRRLEAA
jgi:hypothetical protein